MIAHINDEVDPLLSYLEKQKSEFIKDMRKKGISNYKE